METESIHSLPIMWDEKSAMRRNHTAKEKDTLILLKPYFAQDISKIQTFPDGADALIIGFCKIFGRRYYSKYIDQIKWFGREKDYLK